MQSQNQMDTGNNLPRDVGLSSLQNVLCEGWGLQLVLVKRKVVHEDGIRGAAGEPQHGVGRPRRLHAQQGNNITVID